MEHQRAIEVGTVVVATRRSGVCDVGEPGVCYEVYELDGRPGWSFIFRSGRYDGFSPEDVDLFLHVTGMVCRPVAGYRFRNTLRLTQDFHAGLFDPAFPLASGPGPQARH